MFDSLDILTALTHLCGMRIKRVLTDSDGEIVFDLTRLIEGDGKNYVEYCTVTLKGGDIIDDNDDYLDIGKAHKTLMPFFIIDSVVLDIKWDVINVVINTCHHKEKENENVNKNIKTLRYQLDSETEDGLMLEVFEKPEI